LLIEFFLSLATTYSAEIVEWLLGERVVTSLLHRLNGRETLGALETVSSILGELLAETKIYGPHLL
jgi:hypothetical protein